MDALVAWVSLLGTIAVLALVIMHPTVVTSTLKFVTDISKKVVNLGNP